MKTGTNLTGGDTAWQDWSGTTPVSGTHYMFVSNQDVDYLLKKGCNVFRLVFGWEAIQPTPLAAIPSSVSGHANYFNKMKAVADYITSKGAEVILDIHDGLDADFAAYYGINVGGTYNGYSVGSLLVDFWKQLATIFKGNSKVSFGITNEPHDLGAPVWYMCAQQIVNGIRSTGATNMIVMPGVDWTGAGSWMTNNAGAWNIVDPLKNTAVQVHLYADSNSGGGTTEIQSATVLADRMKQVTTWARGKGLKVIVAEVGLSAINTLAPTTWQNFVNFCNTNSDTVIGFLFWAYGPPSWWGGYRFTLCPTSSYTVDSPQMKLIAPSLTGLVVPTPTPAPTPTPTPDPTIVQLQAQVADLTAKLKLANDANLTYVNQVASLLAFQNQQTANLAQANNTIATLSLKISTARTALA